MNYISCVIQILEKPTIKSYADDIKVYKFRVRLPYVRNKTQSPIIINSQIWGDLGKDIVNYYQINDYALIEGCISGSSEDKNKEGEITINISKLYPFLFALGERKSK
jgi:hypothetical protein